MGHKELSYSVNGDHDIIDRDLDGAALVHDMLDMRRTAELYAVTVTEQLFAESDAQYEPTIDSLRIKALDSMQQIQDVESVADIGVMHGV